MSVHGEGGRGSTGWRDGREERIRAPGRSRREFLATAGAGAIGLGAVGPRVATDSYDTRPGRATFQLGVASYSLRNFSPEYLIHAVHQLGARHVNLKSFHQPYEATPGALRASRARYEAAGLEIVGGGTITLQTDTDADVRRYFEYASASRMPLMVIAPSKQTLPRIERFVREYDIAVAIHNHGPEDEHFPGPQDILPVVRDMDARVGVCLDAGHTARTGIDVAEAAEMCGARLLDVHMKDLADLSARESQCVVGEGAMPTARFFDALTRIGYQGFVNLEYEIDPMNPLPGMQRSFAHMRGVLAGLAV